MMLPPPCFTVGDGIGQVLSGAWFPPYVTLGIQAKEFNPGVMQVKEDPKATWRKQSL
jgi:hypothetical protein